MTEPFLALPNVVSPAELLARYLTQHNHFRPQDHSVKPRAFEPPSNNLRLSVFRIDGLDLQNIWEIGQVNVIAAMPEPRNLYGFAEIKASAIRAVNLDIDPDNVPQRHACIVGWPEEKSERMQIAQELAARARLRLRPLTESDMNA